MGIGTDIIEIERIKYAVDRNKKFLTKYFTENEIALFKLRNFNKSTIAANFAVKEAVSKALGTGFRGFAIKDIEVLRDKKGKPIIYTYNKVKELQKKMNIKKWFVSISHSKDNAVAFVVAEGDEIQ